MNYQFSIRKSFIGHIWQT